eukprot:SAG31_NODE_4789_length_2955_cov_1.493347_4_plen_177_part_00
MDGLAKYLEEDQLAEVLQHCGPVDHFDAESKWWTDWNDSDNENDMNVRYANFLSTVRCHKVTDDGSRPPRVVVVGHSHFIRHFCKRLEAIYTGLKSSDLSQKQKENNRLMVIESFRRYFPPELVAADSHTAGRLVAENIGNACCIMVRMEFGRGQVGFRHRQNGGSDSCLVSDTPH